MALLSGLRARSPRRAVVAAALTLTLALLAAVPVGAAGQTFLTQDEALALAFGSDVTIERRTAYLAEEQLARAGSLAARDGGEAGIEGGVVSYYVASLGGEPVGVAYFDAHRVRTLPEVLMVAVEPGGRVTRVEVLKFSEPPDYLAPEGWLDQFEGRTLGPELSRKGAIVNMTGATLTSIAVTRAVRRALALHRVIDPLGEGGSSGGGAG